MASHASGGVADNLSSPSSPLLPLSRSAAAHLTLGLHPATSWSHQPPPATAAAAYTAVSPPSPSTVDRERKGSHIPFYLIFLTKDLILKTQNLVSDFESCRNGYIVKRRSKRNQFCRRSPESRRTAAGVPSTSPGRIFGLRWGSYFSNYFVDSMTLHIWYVN